MALLLLGEGGDKINIISPYLRLKNIIVLNHPETYVKHRNSNGSVISEILSDKQKTLLFLCNRIDYGVINNIQILRINILDIRDKEIINLRYFCTGRKSSV